MHLVNGSAAGNLRQPSTRSCPRSDPNIAPVTERALGAWSLCSYHPKRDAERDAKRNSDTQIMHGNAKRQADADANCYSNTFVHADFPRVALSGTNGAAILPVNETGLMGLDNRSPYVSFPREKDARVRPQSRHSPRHCAMPVFSNLRVEPRMNGCREGRVTRLVCNLGPIPCFMITNVDAICARRQRLQPLHSGAMYCHRV